MKKYIAVILVIVVISLTFGQTEARAEGFGSWVGEKLVNAMKIVETGEDRDGYVRETHRISFTHTEVISKPSGLRHERPRRFSGSRSHVKTEKDGDSFKRSSFHESVDIEYNPPSSRRGQPAHHLRYSPPENESVFID